ncbi:MAG: ester cyclase [Alphaproteobacteria bacterium]
MNPSALKAQIEPYRRAAIGADKAAWRDSVHALFAPDAMLHLCHPFGDLMGADSYWEHCITPLLSALPDLERRDMIVMAGTTKEGQDWVGCMGNYMGTFTAPFLNIPPTGQLAHMRYHEFFKLDAGKVTQMQAIWDIPEMMMQAKAWPMAPQLGAYLCTPAPLSQDGLNVGDGGVSDNGNHAMNHVIDMLTALCRYPNNPDPAIMELEKFWHPHFNWYGPAGIGACRGISGFRNWHQIPFLRAMPDRKLDAMGDLMSNWIGEGDYVCETGWPNMRLTLNHDGWMGIAPAGKEVLLRSLDFWRLEDGLIRENWVLVDLLDLYAQIGVDVFARLHEFNKMRSLHPLSIPSGLMIKE